MSEQGRGLRHRKRAVPDELYVGSEQNRHGRSNEVRIRLLILAIVFILNVIAYFLPWVIVNGEVYTGWQFTVPFGAPCIIGFILSALSFKLRHRIRLLNIIAGILIFLGVIGSMTSIALARGIFVPFAQTISMGSGITLEFFLGIILIIVGALQTPELVSKRAKPTVSAREQLQKLQSMYDRGEISRETYLKLKSEIEKKEEEV